MKKSFIFKVLAVMLAMVTGVCMFSSCSGKSNDNGTTRFMNTPTGEPFNPVVTPPETTAPETTVAETTEPDTTADQAEDADTTAPEVTAPAEHTKVKFEISIAGKSAGSFTMELYPEYAPITVANFIKLVDEKFYDGVKFHRILDGFMAQGGMNENKQAATIKGEFSDNGVENNLQHDRGIVSMARANRPNSASSQFFICYNREGCKHLDGYYAAFGKVIEGMEVVDSFTAVERTYGGDGAKSAPVQDIVITSAYIVK